MNYGDKQRTKRIFIMLLILACIGLVIFFVAKSSYKREQKTPEGCTNYYEHCVCIGILTGETISISFKSNESETTFSCQGFEYCWNINETSCP